MVKDKTAAVFFRVPWSDHHSLSVVPNNLFIVSIDLSLTISHYMIIQYDEKIYMYVCLTLFQFVLCDGPLLVSKITNTIP